jgi:uncharacterized protein with von Willebrand factor type A (vWA) domain
MAGFFDKGYFKDWFNRDRYSFTRARFKSRLGWEDTLEDDSYSSYFWRPKTNTELIKKAYQTARDMIIVMNPPFKVNIQISADTASGCTDGRIVAIGSRVFDDPVYTEGEKLDVFCGTTIHEGCHLLYTEFVKYNNWILAEGRNKVKQVIFNILEDERIEETLGDEKPGLVRFLEKSKYYYFDKLYLKGLAEKTARKEEIPTENKAEDLMSVFLSIVRYPKYLTPEMVEKYEDLLEKIKAIITPLPGSTKETILAAEKIYKILLGAFEDLKGKDKKSGGSTEGDKGKAGTKTSAPPDGTSFDSRLKGMIKKLADAEVFSAPKYGIDKDGPDFELSGLPDCSVSKMLKTTDGYKTAKELEGTLEYGSTKMDVFYKATESKKSYQESYDRISTYIGSIRKILRAHSKNYEYTHRGCRSGLLDTDKLAEAYQGVPCVYVRKGEVRTRKVNVCVLIDESGSMAGNDRDIRARDSAILLNEAFGGLPGVDLYIYGHTADQEEEGNTEITVYREPGFNPKYSLGTVGAKYENRDGRAITEIARRIRSKTQENILMFILSDGEPSARGYRGKNAVSDTKKCVDRVEKMGFSLVQVSINYNPEYSSYHPSEMFRNYVMIDDVADLAPALGKIIKKAALGAAKVEIY